MSIEKQNIWQTLLQNNIVQGEEPKSDKIETFWHTKILLAISGWMAALFLLLFLSILFHPFKAPAVALILGTMMIAGGIALLQVPKSDFYENLALAMSFTGQMLIIYAIFESQDEKMQWLLTSIFFIAIALFMPSYIHRVVGSFLAASSFSIALFSFYMPNIGNPLIVLAAAFLWLYEFHYPKYMSAQRAIGYGLALALVYMNMSQSLFFGFRYIQEMVYLGDDSIWMMPLWVGELLSGAVTLYVAWSILKRYGHKFTDLLTLSVFVATMILSAISIEVYGVITSILILLLGFSNSNRILMGLGIVSLLFSISSYYYFLNITLLEKAETLLMLGAVLLILYWVLKHFFLRDKEVENG